MRILVTNWINLNPISSIYLVCDEANLDSATESSGLVLSAKPMPIKITAWSFPYN